MGDGRVSYAGQCMCLEDLMKKGDIVNFRKAVDAGDENLRMILLEDPDGGKALVKKLSIPFYTLEVSL